VDRSAAHAQVRVWLTSRPSAVRELAGLEAALHNISLDVPTLRGSTAQLAASAADSVVTGRSSASRH
jgi:hypothetical protein